MTKIICYLEPIVEVGDGLSESQITELIGHTNWDYVDDDVPATHAVKPKKGITTVVAAVAMMTLSILPASAEWKTAWAEVNNTSYLIPYFPGKRLINGNCYYIWSDDSLRNDGPPNEAGDCPEG